MWDIFLVLKLKFKQDKQLVFSAPLLCITKNKSEMKDFRSFLVKLLIYFSEFSEEIKQIQ